MAVKLLAVFHGPGRLPFAIEPQHAQGAVIFQELGHLAFQVLIIPLDVGGGLLALAAGTAQRVIGMPPVAD